MSGFEVRGLMCRFCHGRGCLACDGERQKAEKRRAEQYDATFPDGPTPLAVLRTPEDAALARKAIGAEALADAFRKLTPEEAEAELQRVTSGKEPTVGVAAIICNLRKLCREEAKP